MSSPERRTVPALPLVDVPAVAALLTRLDLGALRPDDVESFPGRNDIWAGVTTLGLPVFVKRLNGDPQDVRQRLIRVNAMAELLQNSPILRTVRCLGVDDTSYLAVFAYLENAETGTDLLSTDRFTAEVADEVGHMVGTLHTLTPPDIIAADPTGHPLPPTPALAAIPLHAYLELSGAELEIWTILHNDQPLADALHRLRSGEQSCDRTLVHGDLRFDQVLRHDGVLYLTDWEECQVADPARDIGAFVGECLYQGVLKMGGVDTSTGNAEQSVVSKGATEFERLRPLIEAFWRGYRVARPAAQHDAALAARAVGFAGWHMFDRVFAAAHQRHRLSPLERAAAGVGRTALLDAAELTMTVGLGDEQ